MPGSLVGRYVFDAHLPGWRGQGVPDILISAAPPVEEPPGETTPAVILAVSTFAATTGTLQRSWPAGHQIGDLALVFEETASQAPTTPTGFTALADSPQTNGAAGGSTSTALYGFYRRATSASEASISIGAAGGNHVAGFVVFLRGVIDTGNPWDVTAGDTAASSTSVSIPGDTTTVTNCLVLAVVTTGFSANAVPQLSSPANASLVKPSDGTAGVDEIADSTTQSGNGGGLAILAGIKLTAGAYSATTGTLANANVQARLSVAIKPTSVVTPPAVGTEMTYGPYDLIGGWESAPIVGLSDSGSLPWTRDFTGAILYCAPSGIVRLLNNCRARGLRVHLKVTAEPHVGTPSDPQPHGGNDTYRTNYRFDISKWAAQFAAYHTSAIHAAVDAALADGILLSFNLMDEPTHNTWGPDGWMHKAMIDEMADIAKSYFPTVAMGVVCEWQWRAFEAYQKLDNLISQTWKLEDGPATAFRDDGLAVAAANNVRMGFALNLEAGPQKSPCAIYGPSGTLCMMTPAEILDWGTTLIATNGLGQKASGLYLWKARVSTWETLAGSAARVAAMYDVALAVAAETSPGWYRVP